MPNFSILHLSNAKNVGENFNAKNQNSLVIKICFFSGIFFRF